MVLAGGQELPRPTQEVRIASYDTYAEAEQALDRLTDLAPRPPQVTIVGSGLQWADRSTSRAAWARIMGAGLVSGAWLGLLIAVMIGLVAITTRGWQEVIFAGVGLGALTGMVFGAVSYLDLASRRDVVARTRLAATRYDLVADVAILTEGREYLEQFALLESESTAEMPTRTGSQPTSRRAWLAELRRSLRQRSGLTSSLRSRLE